MAHHFTHFRYPIKMVHHIASNEADKWTEASVCLPAGHFGLLFTATQAKTFSSDIAIDDIQLGDQCSTTLTIAPTHTGFIECKFMMCNSCDDESHIDIMNSFIPCIMTFDNYSTHHTLYGWMDGEVCCPNIICM